MKYSVLFIYLFFVSSPVHLAKISFSRCNLFYILEELITELLCFLFSVWSSF